MFLAEHLSLLTAEVDEYSRTELITSSEIKADFRTEKTGLIRGVIEFIDESKLFFINHHIQVVFKPVLQAPGFCCDPAKELEVLGLPTCGLKDKGKIVKGKGG